MKRSSSSTSLPRQPLSLSGGSAGDIPLNSWQLSMGAAWWLVWVAFCVVAVWMSPVHAAETSTLAWAAPANASSGGAPQTPVSTPEQQVLQSELQNLLQGTTQQVGRQLNVPDGIKPRVEVVLGRLDPRLKLAPCDKVRAYLPEGTRLWGRTRVGLRCEQGATRWNVYWPLTVKVFAPAVVAVVPLKPGTIMTAADLRLSEVDLAESSSPAVLHPQEVIGRSVLRVIEPGQGLRQDDVRMRRWFAAGDPVRVTVKGNGFAVASEGLALSHGDEGQCARVRVEGGRVLCARPIAERQAEVTL
jgi:flagella basal body P-ring formation protein FlgA